MYTLLLLQLSLLAFLFGGCNAKCDDDKVLLVGHYWDLQAFDKPDCPDKPKKHRFYHATGPADGPDGGGCWNLPHGAVSWVIRDKRNCRVTAYNLRNCKSRGKEWSIDHRPWVRNYKAGKQSNLRYKEWGIHSYRVKCIYDKR